MFETKKVPKIRCFQRVCQEFGPEVENHDKHILLLTDPSLDLSSGFIQISQNKLNNSMKKVAEENENHLQHVFSQNIKYANLLMDTGTVNNFKVLHFVITNPNYPEIIWPFDNYENTNYDGSQYTTVITEVLAHLE